MYIYSVGEGGGHADTSWQSFHSSVHREIDPATYSSSSMFVIGMNGTKRKGGVAEGANSSVDLNRKERCNRTWPMDRV